MIARFEAGWLEVLFSSPAHAIFCLLDENSVGEEFGANGVGFGEVAGVAGRGHLSDFLIDLLIGERSGTENVLQFWADVLFAAPCSGPWWRFLWPLAAMRSGRASLGGPGQNRRDRDSNR